MFVVCKLVQFQMEQVNGPRVDFEVLPGNMAGYLPVYHTREDALADYPDAELMEIRIVEPQEV